MNRFEKVQALIKLDTDKLDLIVTSIDEFAESQNDYYTNNTDNPCAEHITWGWKESDTDDIYDRLIAAIDADFSEPKLLIALLKKSGTEDDQLVIAMDCCSPQLLGIERNNLDLYSISIGEVEEQLPDDICEQLSQLSAEEIEYIEGKVSEYMKGDYLYLNRSYERWAMILDIEQLVDRLTDV